MSPPCWWNVGGMGSRVPRTLAEHLAIHERLVIIKTLALQGYSRKRTAEILGVTRNYLWSRMRKLSIDVPRTTAGRPKKLPT